MAKKGTGLMKGGRFDKKGFKEQVRASVKMLYRKDLEYASQHELYQAVSNVIETARKRLKISVWISILWKIRSRIRLSATAVLEDWQHVSWIHWPQAAIMLMAAASVTTTVCSSRRSRMVSRKKFRITG